MPERFAVPQFIDVEDKILGPITVRQFLIILVTTLLMFLAFKLFDFTLFLLVAIPEAALGGTIAFIKVNGMPFHFFMLNVVQTFRRPHLRVWNKDLDNTEVKGLMKIAPPPPRPPHVRKAPLAATRLAELTLIVNTGGVYNPDE